LADLLMVILPELERRRAARLESRAGRKRKLVANDGRPRVVTPVHKMLMTLIYLRHNVQHEVVSALFRFSADTAENAFHEVMPVLRDCFPAEKWDAEKTWRKGDPTWTPEEVLSQTLDEDEQNYHFLLSTQPRHKTAPLAIGTRSLWSRAAPCEWRA
jgi:Helix-turn-helix of DDE superfamily endonuclease